MVTSPHYLASLAGARILDKGGNAVDAAVATNAVLNVVYPHMCSPGGDAFWLIYSVTDGRVRALNASGRAPKAATTDFFRKNGHEAIPVRGVLPVTVPGAVDGWSKALESFGTMRFSQVLEPAIHYADEGFPVSEKLSRHFAQQMEVLSSFPTTVETYLKNGKPDPGTVLRLPKLAATLRRIAEDGPEALYKGEIGRRIIKFCREMGGIITEEDLASHTSNWVEPITTTYRGYDVHAFPPNTQGIVTLLELNLAELFDLRSMGHLSADAIHVMVEAKKLAFEDREQVSDPEFVKIPVKDLISKERAARKAKEIDLKRARRVAQRGGDGDTVFIATADRQGNVVSLIQSIYYPFGSGVVAGDTGIILQNRGAYFSLDRDHPNRIEPGKRTLHTLSPIMVFKDGKPAMAVGTMGRDGQPQFHFQVLTNIIDFGLTMQEAVEAPRWISGRIALEDPQDVLLIEGRVPRETVEELRKRGHEVKQLDDWTEAMGHSNGILFSGEVMMGGADPRSDGLAVGL